MRWLIGQRGLSGRMLRRVESQVRVCWGPITSASLALIPQSGSFLPRSWRVGQGSHTFWVLIYKELPEGVFTIPVFFSFQHGFEFCQDNFLHMFGLGVTFILLFLLLLDTVLKMDFLLGLVVISLTFICLTLISVIVLLSQIVSEFTVRLVVDFKKKGRGDQGGAPQGGW